MDWVWIWGQERSFLFSQLLTEQSGALSRSRAIPRNFATLGPRSVFHQPLSLEHGGLFQVTVCIEHPDRKESFVSGRVHSPSHFKPQSHVSCPKGGAIQSTG